MNENVIMNDEMMDNVADTAVEGATTNGAASVVMTTVKIGAVTLGGIVLYKKVIKPIINKVKAKKAAKQECTETVELEDQPIKPIFDEDGNAIED